MRALRIIEAYLPTPGFEAGDAVARYLASAQRRAKYIRMAFVLIILAPTSLAALYYGLLASDRYVSQATFIVRGISSPRTSGLDMFFRTFGISRAVDDTNAIQNYMLSRDAVRALEAGIPLRTFFSRPEADALARFPHFWRGDSFERLYEYFLEHISVVQDPSKGLTELRVTSFRPGDSLRVANALVGLAEDFVNRMNTRAQNDAVDAAQREVAEAEQRLVSAQAELTAFRNRELVVDPSVNSISVVETITSLSKDLAQTEAELAQSRATSPSNPAIPVWEAKSQALRAQIALQRGKLGGKGDSLGGKVSAYERLSLSRELAENALSGAEASLELARQEARRQQIYIEEVVKPDLPDESTEPERLRAVATVFVASFAVFAMIWILFAGVKEHGYRG